MSVVNSIEIQLEILINVSRQRVWIGLTNEINNWWLPDFHALGDSTVMLEAKAGGRLYEKTNDGAEGLWYTIESVYPTQVLEMVGHLRPEYGGPATSLLKISLESRENQTVLKLHDALHGAVNDKTKNSITAGWKQLFEDGLKKYLEG